MSNEKPTQELQLHQCGAVAKREPSTGLSLEDAFHAVVNGDMNAEKLAVMKDLLAMSAEQKFNAAFVKLQSELPTIVATSIIQNRGKYAKFEDVMKEIAGPLQANGFSVSFSMDFKESRVLETCHLSHIGGHSRSNSFAVRTGKADSDTQADCKAATTAKRNALCNALNIVIRQDCLTNEDDDATLEGDPNAKVTQAQADELENRAQLTNSNIPAFLRFAGAASFKDIPASRYEDLDRTLRLKERQGK